MCCPDHSISSQMAQRPEFNLKRPAAYHYDLALLGVTTIICGLVGVPPPQVLLRCTCQLVLCPVKLQPQEHVPAGLCKSKNSKPEGCCGVQGSIPQAPMHSTSLGTMQTVSIESRLRVRWGPALHKPQARTHACMHACMHCTLCCGVCTQLNMTSPNCGWLLAAASYEEGRQGGSHKQGGCSVGHGS